MRKQRAHVWVLATLLLVAGTGCEEAIREGIMTGLTSGFATLVDTLITETLSPV